MKKDSLNLESYLEKVWPILEYCTKEIEIDEKTGRPTLDTASKKHIWYLYRQSFYGFDTVVNNTKYYYSAAANLIFTEKSKGTSLAGRSLSNIKWTEQPIFDPQRKFLMLEHMYTGTMFRIDVLKLLKEGRLSIEEVAPLIYDNYNVCWITKEENEKLDKTIRGGNLFEYYEDKKIIIVNV